MFSNEQIWEEVEKKAHNHKRDKETQNTNNNKREVEQLHFPLEIIKMCNQYQK